MDTLLQIVKNHEFDPEQIHELSVAYQNVCLAIDGATPSSETREYVAKEIVRLASESQTNATDLYLNCLEHCRKKSNISIIKQVL
jgi:hypothetical protein